MLFPKSVIFRPHSLDLTGCRVLYETVTTGVGRMFSCDLRSIQWCVKSDWLFSWCVFDSWGTGPWEASTTKYKTESSFLHLCMFNPAGGLACMKGISFDSIRVSRFRAAHNEMWHVTVNYVSLTSKSVFRLQRMRRRTDRVSILCCYFDLVGIWLSSSRCNVLGEQKGI